MIRNLVLVWLVIASVAALLFLEQFSTANIFYHHVWNDSNRTDGVLSLQSRRLSTASASSTLSKTMRPNRTAIVHLGKCGGVSLRLTIGYHLHDNAVTEGFPWYYHMVEPPDLSLHHTWIALVRDPIERIQSAYNYEHPKNTHLRKDKPNFNPADLKEKFQLYDCYPTFNDLVTVGLTTPSQSVNDDCPRLAHRLFQESNPQGLMGMIHFRMNFKAYYTKLLDYHHRQLDARNKIYVVRTEHMVDDLNRINVLMGGIDHAFENSKMKHHAHFTTKHLTVSDRTLSPEGLVNLCRILCSEIQIYKQLLHASLNVDAYAETSGVQLAARCPEQERTSECPSNIE